MLSSVNKELFLENQVYTRLIEKIILYAMKFRT